VGFEASLRVEEGSREVERGCCDVELDVEVTGPLELDDAVTAADEGPLVRSVGTSGLGLDGVVASIPPLLLLLLPLLVL